MATQDTTASQKNGLKQRLRSVTPSDPFPTPLPIPQRPQWPCVASAIAGGGIRLSPFPKINVIQVIRGT